MSFSLSLVDGEVDVLDAVAAENSTSPPSALVRVRMQRKARALTSPCFYSSTSIYGVGISDIDG